MPEKLQISTDDENDFPHPPPIENQNFPPTSNNNSFSNKRSSQSYSTLDLPPNSSTPASTTPSLKGELQWLMLLVLLIYLLHHLKLFMKN